MLNYSPSRHVVNPDAVSKTRQRINPLYYVIGPQKYIRFANIRVQSTQIASDLEINPTILPHLNGIPSTLNWRTDYRVTVKVKRNKILDGRIGSLRDSISGFTAYVWTCIEIEDIAITSERTNRDHVPITASISLLQGNSVSVIFHRFHVHLRPIRSSSHRRV